MIAANESVRASLTTRGVSASWNLHLDKMSLDCDSRTSAKKSSLDLVLRSYHDSRTQNHLEETCKRQIMFRNMLRLQHNKHYDEVVLVNSSRLLLNLGRASVLENVGFACEHSTGLPIISGTAVKGVISTWACWEANFISQDNFPDTLEEWKTNRNEFQNTAERILGSNAESGSISAGEVIFIGGYPITPPKLELDILTPHERGNPIPNPFLALGANTCWIFPLIVRPSINDPGELLRRTIIWLKESFTQIGIGAKTASGYGRFRPLTSDEDRNIVMENQKIVQTFKAKCLAIEQERKRMESEEIKRVASDAIAQEKARQKALLSPEERAYVEYVDNISDWTAPAREIASKTDPEKQHILRYFRTPKGQALLKTWTSEKGKKRIQNLKEAGL